MSAGSCSIFICIFPFSNAVHFSAMCREEVGGGVVERGLGKVFCSSEGNMAPMMRIMLKVMMRVLGMIKFITNSTVTFTPQHEVEEYPLLINFH